MNMPTWRYGIAKLMFQSLIFAVCIFLNSLIFVRNVMKKLDLKIATYKIEAILETAGT